MRITGVEGITDVVLVARTMVLVLIAMYDAEGRRLSPDGNIRRILKEIHFECQ